MKSVNKVGRNNSTFDSTFNRRKDGKLRQKTPILKQQISIFYSFTKQKKKKLIICPDLEQFAQTDATIFIFGSQSNC